MPLILPSRNLVPGTKGSTGNISQNQNNASTANNSANAKGALNPQALQALFDSNSDMSSNGDANTGGNTPYDSFSAYGSMDGSSTNCMTTCQLNPSLCVVVTIVGIQTLGTPCDSDSGCGCDCDNLNDTNSAGPSTNDAGGVNSALAQALSNMPATDPVPDDPF